MKNISDRIVGVSFLVLVAVYLVNGQQQQLFSIWTISNCPNAANWTSPSDAVGSYNYTVPAGVNSVYFKVNGLYGVQTCNATNCGTRSIKYGPGTSACQLQSTGAGIDRLLITRFGDVNQNAQEIHFFTDQSFSGTSQVVDRNGTSGLNFAARSYYFTGPWSWGINNGAQCLNFNGYGITYTLSANPILQLTSVNFTCESIPDPDPTGPTTMRPTPVPTTPTTPCPGNCCDCCSSSNTFDFEYYKPDFEDLLTENNVKVIELLAYDSIRSSDVVLEKIARLEETVQSQREMYQNLQGTIQSLQESVDHLTRLLSHKNGD